MTNEVVGSPAYLAPEIISGKSVTSGQADIYSLGATLYHLLAGIPPFGGDSVATILKNAMIGDIPPVRSVRRSIPRDLETICGKSMEKAPGKRYATAQEMAEDLERYLRGEPIVARPIGRLEKSWRWCQKRPAQAALLALGALVMVASTVTAIYINGLRLEAERNAAESDELHHFLTDVLRSPDPSVDGREITIAERLEYSLGAVDSQLADQPRRRAAILTTIGRTFFGLGLYDKAVESLEFAEAIYEDLPDSKPRDLLYCRNFLAMSRSSLGVSEKDILADLQQIKQAWQMNPGTMDHRYLEILEASGNCYLRQSMFQEALSEFRVAVELSSSINGKDSIETIGCRQQYGRVLVELSRFDEAIAMFENDLALLKSLGLDGALEEMHLLGSLAQALRLNGQASRAFDIQDRAYNISVAQLGEDHPVTLLRMQSLALLYLSHPENKSHAHELFSRRYELCKSTFGENHPTTLGAQSQLGLGLDGSDPEVEKRLIENLEDLIPRMKKHIGSENKMTLAAQQNLASMLARKSRTVTGDERTKCVEEAAAIFEEISPVAREVFGENGRNRCYIDRGFATILEYQNKLAEAAKLRQSLIPGLASNYGKQHPRSYREFYSAIALFCRAEEFDECQSLARKFVDEYASHSDGVELYLVMCHSILADIYVRKGQVELAETALQAVFEIEQQHKDLIGRYTMGYTNAIKARCAMECDDAELAAERLRLADELMSPLPEGPPPIIQWRISQFAKWGEELRDRIGKQ
jgi:tetratricopeptide (TPR) repeat protein